MRSVEARYWRREALRLAWQARRARSDAAVVRARADAERARRNARVADGRAA
jgi:hypothetical protein